MPAAPATQARIVSGPSFEVIAELAAFASGPARASLESGKPWIREVRRLAGPELIARVEGWAIAAYGELASIAIDAGPPFEPTRLLAQLRSMEPAALRRRLLGAESRPNMAMLPDGTMERAIGGHVRARAAVRRTLGPNPQARQSIDRLFTMAPEAIQSDIVAIVEDWVERVFPAFADEALALVARDVKAKRQLFRTVRMAEALRVATNGVEFDLGWASEIYVVPTVALRPFIAPVETATASIVLCSVGDEAFDDDPAAPPRRLVQVAAALGDELRLRILHELAGGDRTASQIATRLGVDRTSLHHHLGILRSAGLVAVRATGVESWRYSLRADGIATASTSLASYLGTGMFPTTSRAAGRRG